MAISCEPADLAAAASCFACLSHEQREAVKTYLLAVIAGGSLDPATLMAQASCFTCVKDPKALQNYLLCQVLNGSSPGTDCAMLSGVGDPTGVTTPEFSGQLYHDTNADTYYYSTGTTSANWTEITTTCPEQLLSTVPAASANELGIVQYSHDILGMTEFKWTGSSIWQLDLESHSDVQTIDLHNLIDVADNDLYLSWLPSLTALDLTSLTFVDGRLILNDNTSLVTLNLPAFVNLTSDVLCYNNTSLANVSMPGFLPPNPIDIDFHGCALSLASVNHILARCVANAAFVAGSVNISGGTSAACPTGPGTDHDILTARGVSITHN